MSHGHGSHEPHGNMNNMIETDEVMPHKIRPIDLIKFNPNMFHMNPFDVNNIWNTLGGVKSAITAGSGALLSYWYYMQKLRHSPATYYTKVMLTFWRIFFGFAIGSTVGFLKFGDRQGLHNAWVAERLRRRYPESMELNTTSLWKFKGEQTQNEFYKWT